MTKKNRLFGIDRYGIMIYDGDIIKYFNVLEGMYKVGHIWHCDFSLPIGWIISFNHAFSETSDIAENIRNIRKLGNIQDNEDILETYHENYYKIGYNS